MNQIPDNELPDELPEQFKGYKQLVVHYNYGRDGGAAIHRWFDQKDRAWPIQEQYDTRKAKPAKGNKPAFEPPKTGAVIIDASQPDGFYGEVVANYQALRDVWKKWRAEKRANQEKVPA
jgi:hypothetical protein